MAAKQPRKPLGTSQGEQDRPAQPSDRTPGTGGNAGHLGQGGRKDSGAQSTKGTDSAPPEKGPA